MILEYCNVVEGRSKVGGASGWVDGRLVEGWWRIFRVGGRLVDKFLGWVEGWWMNF
jgi:hypothetical protein